MSTAISWCDETWNPVTGCTKVSPGCANCYAASQFPRYAAMERARIKQGQRYPPKFQAGFGTVTCHPHTLRIPRGWKKPKRIFVCSMSDLFHPRVPVRFVRDVFRQVEACPQHTFQVLTKRPWRMEVIMDGYYPKPLSNVHLGVTVESAAYADRVDVLIATPAAVRFVSVEPMLDEVGLTCEQIRGVDQVIVGCESVSGRVKRLPGDSLEDFFRCATNVFARCHTEGTAFFMKQWPGLDGKVCKDLEQLKQDPRWGHLSVREYPDAAQPQE